MLSQEVINTANQLPPSAQKMVEELVELLSFKHLSKSNTTSAPLEVTENEVIEKPKYRYGKKAGFGLFSSNIDITDDIIDNAIAKAVSEI